MKQLRAVFVSCCLVVATCLTSPRPVFAQGPPALPLPQPSPEATVSQTIGITKITINYHRPGVKNRKVWGNLVPYGQVWRAGANENTTISFSHPVKLEGKELPAGTYGLHMIPTEGEWTIIFSKNSTSWGSFFYKEAEDALRVKATPSAGEHQEWLSYEFADIADKSVTAMLHWEKLKLAFKIEIDVPATVVAYARSTHTRGIAGFFWQGFNEPAAYCLRNNVNLEQALEWSNRSLQIAENFTNMRTKAGILEKLGRTAEAKTLNDRAMQNATEADINTLGYEYVNAGKMKEAIETFKKNTKDYPNSWNTHDSLGEALERNGDSKLAVESYAKALKLVKDDVNKKRLTETLQKLQGK